LEKALEGKHDIFLDTKAIPAGDSFEDRIISYINKCDLVLAVIGDRWLGVDYSSGSIRIQDPSDWVRRELEIALSRKIKIIPVTIDDFTFSSLSTSLPESLKELLSLNAIPVRNGYEFYQNSQRLVDDIKKYFYEQKVLAEAEQRRRENKDVEVIIKLDKGRLNGDFWSLKCKEIEGFSKGLSSGGKRFYFVSYKDYTFHISYSCYIKYPRYVRHEFGTSQKWNGFLHPGTYTFECGLEKGLTILNTANFIVSAVSVARLTPVNLYLKSVDYQRPIVN